MTRPPRPRPDARLVFTAATRGPAGWAAARARRLLPGDFCTPPPPPAGR